MNGIHRLVVALVASMLASGIALGFCPPVESRIFLHLSPAGKIDLPANARGILLLPELYPHTLAQDDDGHAIVSAPATLSVRRFHIRERASGRQLTPVLVRLRVEKQMGRYWSDSNFLASRALERCASRPGTQTPLCRELKSMERDWMKPEQPGQGDKVKRFALQQGLRNISEQVDAANGLYRLQAREGFKPGHVYDIEYRDGRRRVTAHVRVETTVLRMSAQDRFDVEMEAPSRREWHHIYHVGPGGVIAVQPLRMALPSAYEAYRPLLLYFMQHNLQRDDSQTGITPGHFTPFNYGDPSCNHMPYGGSFHGYGRELAIGDCKAPSPRLIKGYAGVLEVEDSLHETASLAVTFPDAPTGACPLLTGAFPAPYPVYAVPP